MGYTFLVSKAGVDVKTASSKDLILEPDANFLQMGTQGTTQVVGSAWGTITHNLGYVPQFLVYIQDPTFNNDLRLCLGGIPLNSYEAYANGIARAGTDNLYFVSPSAGTNTLKVYYYIFYQHT